MRAIRWLQTLFAILSIPCLLGWTIVTIPAVAHLPGAIGSLAAAESIFEFLKGLAIILLASTVIVLGWWGWHALWWVYFFYPPLARRHPKWVTLGNIAGSSIVLIQLAIFFSLPQSSKPYSFKLSELPEAIPDLFLLFVVFGGAPLFLLFTNLLAAHHQRKFLYAQNL
ncbi:MAG: hypothetical protein ACKVLM_06135 [Pseudomonadales bacterium]